MIVITGAAGFIGSALCGHILDNTDADIVIVDDFSAQGKWPNYQTKQVKEKVDRKVFLGWIDVNHSKIDAIYHLGARTDTAEMDTQIFDTLNLNYSKTIWNACTQYQIPLLYASSAATYGNGELGYVDSHTIVDELKPLNPYGDSKNDFDKWVLTQETTPPHWYGVKFFNVYGPNEYHKGRMASVVFHCYHQILKNGSMALFKSHKEGIADGQQSRDFIYIKDVLDMCSWLIAKTPESGLYNIGTGKARSFYDLAVSTFNALSTKPNIHFIDTPEDIREKYQYYTQADMTKLIEAGYDSETYSLEEGIHEYVQTYLGEQVII